MAAAAIFFRTDRSSLSRMWLFFQAQRKASDKSELAIIYNTRNEVKTSKWDAREYKNGRPFVKRKNEEISINLIDSQVNLIVIILNFICTLTI